METLRDTDQHNLHMSAYYIDKWRKRQVLNAERALKRHQRKHTNGLQQGRRTARGKDQKAMEAGLPDPRHS